MKEYTLHSGGAIGADFTFEVIGRKFGLTNINQYWYGKMNPHSKLEDEISEEDYLEGVEMVHKANRLSKIYEPIGKKLVSSKIFKWNLCNINY